jgi:Uncharacterized protein conserved in bacteria (DUF2317).
LLALHGHGVTFDDALASLDDHVKRMLAEISAIDPTLQRTVARSHDVLGRTIDRLRGKTAAALALRDTVTTQQFARLRGMLLPMGGLQERTISPFAYFAKFGIDAVMRRMRSIGDHGRHDLPIDEPSGPPRPRS